MVKVRESEVQRANTMKNFRGKELKRFQGLASGNHPALTPDVLDERTLCYEEAVAASAAAEAAVLKARADLEEAKAKLGAARDDVSLKEVLVGVARKDKDKAQDMLDFATVRA